MPTRLITASWPRIHQLGQGLSQWMLASGMLTPGWMISALVRSRRQGRYGDLDAALRQAVDDVGTDETATPSSKTFLMSMWTRKLES